jgi:HEAT repeat protein
MNSNVVELYPQLPENQIDFDNLSHLERDNIAEFWEQLIDAHVELDLPGADQRLAKLLCIEHQFAKVVALSNYAQLERPSDTRMIRGYLEHEDQTVRRWAICALAVHDGLNSTDQLGERLLNESEHEDVRAQAAHSLGFLPHNVAARYLHQVLRTVLTPHIVEYVVSSLARLGDHTQNRVIIELYLANDFSVTPHAAASLQRMVDQGISDIVCENMLSPDEQRRHAAYSLAEMLDCAIFVDPLIERLAVEESLMKNCVIHALGQLGGEAVVSTLVKALDRTDRWRYQHIIRVLSKCGGTLAVDALIAELEGGPDWASYYVLPALVDGGHIVPLSKLEPFLDDSRRTERRCAVELLSRITDKINARRLSIFWQDEDQLIRSIVAKGLGQTRDADHVERLQHLLQDAGNTVQWEALNSLVSILGIEAIWLVHGYLQQCDFRQADDAVRLYADLLQGKAIIRLIELLDHRRACIRQSAAMVLGSLGDRDAIGPLLDLIEHGQSIGEVKYAVESLVQLHDEQFMERLFVKMKKQVDHFEKSALGIYIAKFGDAGDIERLCREFGI